MAVAIQEAEFSAESFRAWLTRWMLARTIPTSDRERARSFLNGTARPALMSHPIGNAAYELVEQLAVKARDKAFWHRPTSLMSKLAFCCDPLIYAPYDRRARTALQARGYTIADHDYCAYMSAFNLEKEHWARALRSEGRTAGPRYLGQQMERGLFEMRAFDKKLMLMGGFDAKRMMKDFDESLFD